MAHLYPSKLPLSTNSGGEISIFNKIERFGQDLNWSVMHSYNVPNHPFKKWGEIDFLIIVPKKGVVCLEVKDHKEIVYENRSWFYGKRKKRDKDPFKQIISASTGLCDDIKKRQPGLNVPWWHAVIFTSAQFQEGSLPPEVNNWEFMDAKCYAESDQAFFKFIENVMDKGREKLDRQPNSSWVTQHDENTSVYRQLTDTLSGRAVFSISKTARDGDRKTSLSLATEEQYKILDLLSQTPRLLVEGLAGTGKTLMASKIAERESSEGKVLFLAFNRNLIDEIKFWPSLNSSNITVESIDRFFKGYVKETVDPNKENYWDKILPMQFSDITRKNHLEEYYDYLVLDEAQDILSKPFKLSALNKILRGGLSEGKWSFFGDFNEQLIYSPSSSEEVFRNLKSYCSENRYIQWDLGKNSRNPIDIGTFAQQSGRIDRVYDEFLRHERGEVQYVIFDEENRFDLIEEKLKSLFEENYEPSEIVLLSQYKMNRQLSKHLSDRGIILRDYNDLNPSSGAVENLVRFSTISSFKGLESPVVILMDITNLTALGPLFYIGITRATDKLIIHGTREAISEI